MPFLIAAKISIHSRQNKKKVINSLNDCMVGIDSERQFVVTLRYFYFLTFILFIFTFIYINFDETKVRRLEMGN